MKIGAIDLFCGVGGLTHGLEKSGINVVAGFDLDKTCQYAYEANNKSRFVHKDIRDITAEEIQEKLKGFDVKVIAGCAPCQPFSNHRKDKFNRKGHKDWGLLGEFLRLVKEVNPDIVSMENVPQLKKEEIFEDFENGLKDLGYFVTYIITNSYEYGVPQRRKRLLLLASKNNKIEFIAPTHKDKLVTVADAIKHLPRVNAGIKCDKDVIHVSRSLKPINIERIKQSKPGGTWHDWDKELLPECYKKPSGKTYTSVYGRMKWDEPSPTITTQFNCYGTGRFGHPEQDRALTLREGALLQTFPDNYKFTFDDKIVPTGAIAKHIGNAVPPKLGEVVGLSIKNNTDVYYGESTI